MARYTAEEIKEKVARDGSIAFHVDHEWYRNPKEYQGVWCLTCEQWVIKPKDGNGSSA